MRVVFVRMNADQYVAYLEMIIPYSHASFGHDFFLQNNAPSRTARIASDFLGANLPGQIIEHPPYSPDSGP